MIFMSRGAQPQLPRATGPCACIRVSARRDLGALTTGDYAFTQHRLDDREGQDRFWYRSVWRGATCQQLINSRGRRAHGIRRARLCRPFAVSAVGTLRRSPR